MNRIVFAALSLFALNANAGVQEALSLQQGADGNFSVICKDSSFQSATAAQIKTDAVCRREQLSAGLYRIASGSDSWYCTEHRTTPRFDSSGKITSVVLELAGNCSSGSVSTLTCGNDGICRGPTPSNANGGARSMFDIAQNRYTYKVADRSDQPAFTRLPDNKSLAIENQDFRVRAGEAQ